MAALVYFVFVLAVTTSASEADKLVEAVNMADLIVSRDGTRAAADDSSPISGQAGAANGKPGQPPSWQPRNSGQTREVEVRDNSEAAAALDPKDGLGRTGRQAANVSRAEVLSLLSLVESRISVLASFLTSQYRTLDVLGAKMDASRHNVSAVLTRLQESMSGLSHLRSELNSQGSRMSSVDGRLSNVYNSLSSVDGRLNNVYNSVSSLSGRFSSVESRLSSLGNLNGVSAQLEGVRQDVANLNNSVSAQLNAVRQEVANLNNALQRQSSLQTINVRLVGSSRPNQGRVEISVNGGAWGTVCDDGWSDRGATVVCRSLGYRSGVGRGEAFFGRGTGDILLDDVYCTGVENNLLLCPHRPLGVHDCGHHEDAGVICSF